MVGTLITYLVCKYVLYHLPGHGLFWDKGAEQRARVEYSVLVWIMDNIGMEDGPWRWEMEKSWSVFARGHASYYCGLPNTVRSTICYTAQLTSAF